MRSFKLSFTLAPAFLAILAAIAPTAAADEVGLANPASEFCGRMRGNTEILTAQDGQIGFCRLDQALIEEWTLMRAATGDSQQAVDAYLNHVPFDPGGAPPGANPASVYCGQVGGSSLSLQASDGGAVGACLFPDRSMIEEWTLFRGPQDRVNRRFTRIVQNR